MFEYFLIFVNIRFINFARLGLLAAAKLTLAKLNLINVNFRQRENSLNRYVKFKTQIRIFKVRVSVGKI